MCIEVKWKILIQMMLPCDFFSFDCYQTKKIISAGGVEYLLLPMRNSSCGINEDPFLSLFHLLTNADTDC